MKKSVIALCLSMVTLPIAAFTGSAQTRSSAAPNIVVVLADDMGWGDPGCYNPESRNPTPHLDRLASQGMRFTDAHSPSAVCTPTRYGLLTGRYAWRTRLKSGVLWGYSPPLIEPGRTTIATILREHGYATACIGKWHLGLGWATHRPAEFGDRQIPAADPELIDYSRPAASGPQSVGFDYSFILPASLDMEPYVYLRDGRPLGPVTGKVGASAHQRQGGRGFWRAGPAGPGFTHENCMPTLLAEAESFIRRQNRSRPFFLYFPLTAPHDPWVPGSEHRGRSRSGDRGDFVAQVDATVGRILSVLDERGISDNTIVVFASDNGAHWLPDEVERTGHRANGPWRGQKSDAWEGGHRIPFLVRWPGKTAPRSTSDALVCLTDLPATVAELTGTRLPGGACEDSISFLPVLTGKTKATRRTLVLHSINGVFAVRRGDWKLVDARGSGGWSPGEVPEDRQLYNLRDDPGERMNRLKAEPSLARELQEFLRNTISATR